MASTFAFGFSGDDIDAEDAEASVSPIAVLGSTRADDAGETLAPAQRHELAEWLSSLPSQISYSTTAVGAGNAQQPVVLGRRELFDVRAQLMAEDCAEQDNSGLIASLQDRDLQPTFYEGGFKTWECALDLARLLLDTDETDGRSLAGCHVIELGAGSAMPSLALFAKLLREPVPDSQTARRGTTHFTFADYNAAVLRLVTLPNILLTWNASRDRPPGSSSSSSNLQNNTSVSPDEELDITPELLELFQADLDRRGISVALVSGAWSPAFVELVVAADTAESPPPMLLVLASETIYSPSTLRVFAETLAQLLRQGRRHHLSSTSSISSASSASSTSKAYVAAKKMYFGVGGGIDEFLAVLRTVSSGRDEFCVRQKLDISSEGVGRVVLEIQKSNESP